MQRDEEARKAMGKRSQEVTRTLQTLHDELGREFVDNILPYWMTVGRDREGGGFFGHIGGDDLPDPSAEKSAVMVSRHLWTFSAANAFAGIDHYLSSAREAYRFLTTRLWDPESGGVFWSVARSASATQNRKQIYAQAFAIYGLTEYHRRTGSPEALAFARQIFQLLELHARDEVAGGYLEAFTEDWRPTPDRALSETDLDCDKSMNTNLHVLEALSNLLRAGHDPEVAEALEAQIGVLETRVLQPDDHLGLFFRTDWSRMDDKVSYGHDIEASWLLDEAREVLASARRTPTCESDAALRLARVTLAEGFDADRGGVYDERENGEIDPCRIWWVQAEAMVGFLNAYRRTGDFAFLDAVRKTWDFVNRNLIDRRGGEWFWGVTESGALLDAYPKGGNWKTGYHTGRCCMEIVRRTEEMLGS